MIPQKSGWPRLALVGVVFAALLLAGRLSGVAKNLTPEGLRAFTLAAGAWGALAYIAAFSLGQLVQLPGMLFVAAGLLAYGKFWGGGLAWIGALTSVSVTYFVARGVGGSPFQAIENPRVKRILARIETHPLLTVVALRLFLTTSPPLNYALALSGIRFRHYFLGSALGLTPAIVLAALLSDIFMRWMA
jgi:uncharacterized membrane protein YdjX (TVP38/TMEM64 family)